jgi:hypothetical protein
MSFYPETDWTSCDPHKTLRCWQCGQLFDVYTASQEENVRLRSASCSTCKTIIFTELTYVKP